MRIVPLSAAPQHRETIVDWQWRAFGGADSRDFFASVVDSSLRGADLPLTFVALDGDRAVGTVGLWRCDLISRQDLFPWLAALFVDERYRGQGLSEQLQQTVIDCCRQRGDRQLYLYSACADYYERFGWTYMGDALDYPATAVRLYYKSLE
ncbi:GNAT family N-acetyltransferase [Erwinia sorbitola]|uniref:GNAT family N-acetyltransferase n=1 Tax=Erwinia sorbitola TaxID=2681984 RepID=A0A6I6F6U9_9GAMM|nr:GNAT family N-acetyltransferase [Erwinia sorbitola]MTD28301.1 GNAT family N-acetyltransferase [Erwinia sorbitola]QGU89620.1 GNAT family N-acetyltransferase [Erwinia sorbitola]